MDKILELNSEDFIIFWATISGYLLLAYGNVINNGKGQSLFSWLLWMSLDLILVKTTHDAHGASESMVLMYTSLFGSTMISISFLFIKKKAEWKNTETITLILMITTVIVWGTTNSPEQAILSAVIAQVIAGIPEIKESWRDPEPTWTLASDILFVFAYSITTFSSSVWNVENKLFAGVLGIYTIICMVPLVLEIFGIENKFKKSNSPP